MNASCGVWDMHSILFLRPTELPSQYCGVQVFRHLVVTGRGIDCIFEEHTVLRCVREATI